MSDVTEVKFWACCTDAIDWSHDGIIAFASEEHVGLLFPNTDYYDKEQQQNSWKHTSIQAPWFTREELQPKYPAPSCNLSVGEEISPSLPISIAWSAPGLAKHRRCALGVLTSSLILSLWSADGKLEEESSWRRRIIINDSLVEYFSGHAGLEENVSNEEAEEKQRLRTRVRGFIWAPVLSTRQASGILGTQLDWDRHLLAMTNDDNQIIVAHVKSPVTTLGANNDWSVKILEHLSIAPETNGTSSEGTTSFDEYMQQQRYISHIAWSPWIIRDGYNQSILAYSTNGDVRARVVADTDGVITIGGETVFAEVDVRNNGAMRWSPTFIDGDKLILALFTHSGITCLTVSSNDATILSQSSNNPDGRCDQNSGIVWDHPAGSAAHLHFSTFTTTMNTATSLLEVSEDSTLSILPTPSWRAQINDSRTLFSVQNELQGHAKSKTWGLCASPLRDFIAACYTLHPSDMIEYGPPAARRSTIAINGLRNFSQPVISFPAGHASTEAIIFTIRKWLDNTVEVNEQVAEFMQQVLAQMLEVYAPRTSPETSEGTSAYDSDEGGVIREFKRQAFLNPGSVKDRYKILASLACSPDDKSDLERSLVAYRLAAATVELPATHSRVSPFSLEILSSHQQVVRLIQSLLEVPAIADDDSPEASERSTTDSTVTTRNDTCDLCDVPIPFTDLNTAACINGHQFPRCGISFLAIQAPRITKSCGMCDTVFLSDEFVKAQEGAKNARSSVEMQGDMEVDSGEVVGDAATSEQGREPSVSLARILFLACDVCIYCGGKFVG